MMTTSISSKGQCGPLVSVVLPVRNGLPYLPAAVDSILRQTYRELELIAIDDGSTDKSGKWLAARARHDRRLRLMENPGTGLVDALNFGISQASGVYIARMDADDIAVPDRFERQVAYLEANQSIDVLGTQVFPIDANGGSTGKVSAFPVAPKDISHALSEGRCVIRHPTVMARRDALVESGGYRSALTYAEDFDLWLRMAERRQLANLAEPTLYYRQHPNSISVSHQLEQQLAHSLALLSAQRRQLGHADPIAPGVLSLNALQTDDAELARLIQAHAALKDFANGSRSQSVLKAVMDAIEFGRFRHSKRYLVSVLSAIRQYALYRGDLSDAWRGLKLSLKIDIFRTLKDLRPNVQFEMRASVHEA